MMQSWVAMFTNWEYMTDTSDKSTPIPSPSKRTDIWWNKNILVTNEPGLKPMVTYLNTQANVEIRFAEGGTCCRSFGHFHVQFDYLSNENNMEISLPITIGHLSTSVPVNFERVRNPTGMNNYFNKLKKLDSK